jgi:hypothetical protein
VLQQFPTGWDTVNFEDLQDWALHEQLCGISQEPIDAAPFIPQGGATFDDLGLYVNTICRELLA